jgi:DNA primase
MEINEIKQRLTLSKVLHYYNLKPDKQLRLNCPFHDDKTPSLQVYYKTHTAYCFSSNCKTHGKSLDVIDFIMHMENISKHEAILKAQSLIIGESNQPKPSIQQDERSVFLTQMFTYFKNAIHNSKPAKEYLQQRKLDYTKTEVGYNSGQFHHGARKDENLINNSLKYGLLLDLNTKARTGNPAYKPFGKWGVVFPLRNKQNKIVSLYFRSTLDDKYQRHFYLKDRQGLYPNYPPTGTKKLILTESIIDAATLLEQEEIKSNYEVLALYGTNGLTDEHKEAIKELKQLDEIIFFLNGDQPGIKAVEKYAEILRAEYPKAKITNVEVPENEDINSLLQGHEPEILSHLLENRKLFLSTEKEKDTVTPKHEKGRLNTANPSYITYKTNTLEIDILGGINLQQLDRLRVTLKIKRAGSSDPLHVIRHTIDLYHSDYLEKFINKASEQLEAGTNTIRRAIAEMTEGLEQYRESKLESMKEQRPKLRQLTEKRYNKAIKYLSSPKLMERTNTDIGKTGMIGEENNRLLMYLVFTSRLREHPLHIISLGASGTGKTYLQEKISELIPEQDKLEITILSENAFYYFDRKELKNKLVLIEDMDGAENVLYPLRELQSKKRISKTIPLKDSKGNLKTITLQVEGPICLAGTTTREKLYEDNANRSLLIYLDGSKQHKEHIMDYQRRLSAGKINSKAENELKEFFKDMQTVLKPIKVRNPYAEMLKLPEYVFKPLRTNAHYLAVIETITFYHQYQRDIKTDPNTGEKYIETTLEDIEWANKLLKDVLLAKSDELPRAVREFFEALKSWTNTAKKSSFYAKEVRETFRMHPSKVKRYLIELLRFGFIKVVGGNRYKSGLEYENDNTEEYQKLESGVSTALDKALNELRKKVSGSVGQQWSTVPHEPLNGNGSKSLKPVVQ